MKWGSKVAIMLGILYIFIQACSGYAAEYTIKVANNTAPDFSWGKGMEKFKEYAEEISDGRIKVEVHHSGALGSTRATVEMLRVGTLETALCGAAYVQSFVPEAGVVLLPYLWKDEERVFEVLDGPLGGYLNAKLEKLGFHNLGFLDNGFRHITTRNKPIISPDDLKGIKIRTLPTNVHIAFFKALGATPTSVDWTELFEALRMGVVDAQENPPAMIYTARFQEVQKYYSLTGHVNEPGCFLMSKAIYDKYPEDVRLMIDVAARRAIEWEREECARDNKMFMGKLREAGMEINEVPAATIEYFRKVAQEQIYPQAAKDLGPLGQELIRLFVWANK